MHTTNTKTRAAIAFNKMLLRCLLPLRQDEDVRWEIGLRISLLRVLHAINITEV